MAIVPMVLIAFGLYVAGMYLYRKTQSGETFVWEKALPTMGIGALVAVFLYLVSGAIPSFDSVLAGIEGILPGGNVSMTALMAVVFGIIQQLLKGGGNAGSTSTPSTPVPTTTGTTAPTVPTTPSTTPTPTVWNPGFTVTPTFQRGVSPLPVTLQVQGGMDAGGKRSALQIDWMDGSPAQDCVLDTETGQATVSHTYNYNASGTKYDAHSFYPEFTLIGSDGAKVSFNTTGKNCEIECQSVIKA